MRHLKTFENTNINKTVYLCSIVYDNSDSTNYIFDNIEDRNTFVINYVHNDFMNAEDDSVDDIFDVDELVDMFNDDHEGDETIYLAECEYMTNVKLDPNIEIKKDAIDYNL